MRAKYLAAYRTLAVAVLLFAGIAHWAGAADQQAVTGVYRFQAVWGKTEAVAGQPGSFQRLLLAPVEERYPLSLKASWEVSADLALDLAAMPASQRWEIVRRKLDLAPATPILWSEVAEAVFAAMSGGGAQRPAPFALRVGFPKGDQPEVALGFTGSAEPALQQEVLRSITGIEGFAFGAGARAAPPLPLAGAKVTLLDEQGKEVAQGRSDKRGYFLFSDLAVDPKFGSVYSVRVDGQDLGYGVLDTAKVFGRATTVNVGERVRFDPVVLVSSGVAAGQAEEVDYRPAIIEFFLAQLPFPIPGLAQALAGLEQRAGVAVAGDSGTGVLYAIRVPFKPPRRDRSPMVVPGAVMRIERWSAEEVGRHYLRIVLSGHATEADLSLKSRALLRYPWGASLGLMPSTDSNLFVLGLSYELNPSFDLVAGAGFGKTGGETRTRLVLGGSLDISRVFSSMVSTVSGGGQQ